MNRFINNLIDLGFSGFILWLIFILTMHWLVNSGFKGLEKYLEISHTVYFYDLIWLIIVIVVFLYGIYSYQ